jgi:hypothetical protein
MKENDKDGTASSKCLLCQGKGFIDVQKVLMISCPVCYFQAWANPTAPKSSRMLISRKDADRLRSGFPTGKVNVSPWTRSGPGDWKSKIILSRAGVKDGK